MEAPNQTEEYVVFNHGAMDQNQWYQVLKDVGLTLSVQKTNRNGRFCDIPVRINEIV